jgi:hypothetical protein
MKFLKCFLFVLCLPVFLLNPIPTFAQESPTFYSQQDGHALYVPRDETGKFDPWELFKAEKLMTNGFQSILDFLELVECDNFLQNLDDEEFLKLLEYYKWCVEFTAKYSKEDKQDGLRHALEDLESIMNGDCQIDDDIGIISLYKHNPDIITYGWLSKQWKKAKKWADKHKGPLIIGAVVVGALVVGAVTGGVGASSAVAVGGALVGGSMDNPPPPDHVNKPGEVLVQSYHDIPSPQPSSIHTQAAPPIQSQTEIMPSSIAFSESLKEELNKQPIEQMPEVQNEIINATESLSNTGEQKPQSPNIISSWASLIGHSVVDGVASIAEYFYDDSSLEDYLNFIRYIDEYHQKVDNIFTYEDKELDTSKLEMQIGVPPVPGGKFLPVVAETAVGTAAAGSVAGSIASNIASSAVTQAVVREIGNISVYQAFDPTTGEVSYVGITNNIDRRYWEHRRGKDITIEPIDNLTNLTRDDAKFVEQTLIKHHELEKNGGSLINKINSIAETNPEYAKALTRGREILLEAGYPGIE